MYLSKFLAASGSAGQNFLFSTHASSKMPFFQKVALWEHFLFIRMKYEEKFLFGPVNQCADGVYGHIQNLSYFLIRIF